MTPYLILAIGAFLLGAILLHRFRTFLICEHRARARSRLIDYNADGQAYWAAVEAFNARGDWETQFWDWRKWKYEDFYNGAHYE